VGKAYYLVGPYTTGKTNTLWQFFNRTRELNCISVHIDGDLIVPIPPLKIWGLITEKLKEFDFVREYLEIKKTLKDETLKDVVMKDEKINEEIKEAMRDEIMMEEEKMEEEKMEEEMTEKEEVTEKEKKQLRKEETFEKLELLQCADAFAWISNNSTSTNLPKIVICIDEAQNFQMRANEFWKILIRRLVRTRGNVFVFCATSAFESFHPSVSFDSPFEELPVYVTYWSQDQIFTSIKLLQGVGADFVEIPNDIKTTISEIIFQSTNGHPFFCAHYLSIIRELLNCVNSNQNHLPIANFFRQFQIDCCRKLWNALLSSRVYRKLQKECRSKSSEFIESSGILYGGKIKYENNNYRHLHLLRLGMVRHVEGFLTLSCVYMRNLYLDVRSPSMPSTYRIEDFAEKDGVLKFLDLICTLFGLLRSATFLVEESWVLDRTLNNSKGPSEKTYQCMFFSLLSGMCGTSNLYWTPIFEMRSRGGNLAVDLGLKYFNEKSGIQKLYLIELGCNCPPNGNNASANQHYVRQVTNYNTKDVTASCVVMIYTNSHDENYYYWPEKDDDKTLYMNVEHKTSSPRVIRLKSKKNQVYHTIQLSQ
jgi:hypothetical protein